MNVSRRKILAGLLVAGATPARAVEVEVRAPDVDCAKAPADFISKGYIVPRVAYNVRREGAFGAEYGVCVIEHDIYDGTKFVPLDSFAGQQVLRELGA